MGANNLGNARIARNSVLMTIRMVFVLIVSIFTTRVVLEALGVDDYGTYNVVCGFVSLFTLFSTAASNGIQRFYNVEIGKNSETGARDVYVTSIHIQLIVAFIIVILSETIGLWYLNNKMVIPEGREYAAFCIFQFSVIQFVLAIVQTPYSASIIAHERLDYFAIVSILDVLLKFGIAFIIANSSIDKLILYGLLMLIIGVSDFLLYSVYAYRKFPEIRYKFIWKRDLFYSMLYFSGWNIFGSFANITKEEGINLVLNYFCGPIVNAARGVASQINSAIQSFVQSLSISVRPQVVQSFARGETERTFRLTYSISKLSCCVLIIMGYPIVLEINYILHLWLGNNVPDHTSSFVVIILLTSIVNNLNAAISGVVHASGEMRNYQLSGSVFSIFTIILAIITSKLGLAPESVLWVSLIMTLFGHVVGMIILKSIVDYSIKEYIVEILIPLFKLLFISFAFPLIPHLLLGEGMIRLLVVTVVSVLTIGLVSYFVCFNSSEKQLINSFITRIIHK